MKFDYLVLFFISFLIQVLVYWGLTLQLKKSDFLLSETSIATVLRDLFMTQSLIHPIAFFVILNSPLNILTNILMAQVFLVFFAGFFMNLLSGRKVFSRGFFLIAAVAQLTSWQLAPLLSFVLIG